MAQPSWSLTESAKRDLLGIAVYTAETWGLGQGDAYIEGLYAHLDRTSQFPGSGRKAGDIPGAMRMTRYQSHIAFYIHDGDAILIVRILHVAQDRDVADWPDPSEV